MRVVVAVPVPRSAPVVWRHVTDWPWQSASIPFTRVFTTRAAGGLGDRFTGRTTVLGVGFDDPMEVVRWQAPAAEPADGVPGGGAGQAVMDKHGRVVLGSAAIRVEPTGPGSCRLVWGEDVEIAPVALTRPVAPALRVAAWWGVRAVLRHMARRIEAGTPVPLR